MKLVRTHRIVLRKEPGGTYTVFVPALPGCITWGETIEQAMEMTKRSRHGIH